MKVGIALDPWKLEIFKKNLDKEGYTYEVFEGEELTTIKVEVADGKLFKTQELIKKMNNEAKRSKKH